MQCLQPLSTHNKDGQGGIEGVGPSKRKALEADNATLYSLVGFCRTSELPSPVNGRALPGEELLLDAPCACTCPSGKGYRAQLIDRATMLQFEV